VPSLQGPVQTHRPSLMKGVRMEKENDKKPEKMTWDEIRKMQEELPAGTMLHIEVDEDAGKDE
jgi:hypothetical protein